MEYVPLMHISILHVRILAYMKHVYNLCNSTAHVIWYLMCTLVVAPLQPGPSLK